MWHVIIVPTGFNIMARASATTVVHDLGSDYFLPKLRN